MKDEYATIQAIARATSAAGGRAWIVGGWVRDRLLGAESKDWDLEIFGLEPTQLEAVLEKFGAVMAVGRAFGVYRLKGLDVDFSLPRKDSKVGSGHRGFNVETDPTLTFKDAARRRDLTVNSMGFDPLTEEIVDPHGGRVDLAARRLVATDPLRFSEDPLRGLRVAQFAARLDMEPTAELRELCATLDLSELSAERLRGEFDKLLLKGQRPSVGLRFLRETDLLRFFPELHALVDVPQDPEWHPEGDVWVHTLMALDRAAEIRPNCDEPSALMYGVLCHDFGKPSKTFHAEGRVRSPGHEEAGVEPTRAFLEKLRCSKRLVVQVEALVRHHLAPALYVKQSATPKAYRRLARRLSAAEVTFDLLMSVATSDHWGRTTQEALDRVFPLGDRFRKVAEEVGAVNSVPDVVLGRHLMARGIEPGRAYGELLANCREVQDETGETDPDRILTLVLDAKSAGE